MMRIQFAGAAAWVRISKTSEVLAQRVARRTVGASQLGCYVKSQETERRNQETIRSRYANGGDRRRVALPLFVAAIFVIGSLRFGLSDSGANDNITRYASMTVVIAIAILYFASRPTGTSERLIISDLLVPPYMLVETVALAYTWRTGTATTFHSPPYTFGVELPVHFWGHVAGGITWEPMFAFLLIGTLSKLFPSKTTDK